MATLEIDGVGRIQVDDSFRSLSPQDQEATVQEIISQIGQRQQQPDAGGSTFMDVAKSIPTGAAKGVMALGGMGGDLRGLISGGADYLMPGSGQNADRVMRGVPLMGGPTTQQVQQGVESVTGPMYKPQTTAGKYAGTVAEFLPGAALPGGGIGLAGRLTRFGALPGVASEAAGQATEGTALEPWARGGAAVLTGAAAGALARPRSAEQALRGRMDGNVNQQAIDQAQQLVDDAAARGINLTWAEAIETVSPGSGLPGIVRHLEGASDTSNRMAQFFAQRPAQVEGSVAPTLNAITPATPAPSTIGPQVGRAAEDAMNDGRRTLNQGTRPYYDAARGIQLQPGEMARVRALPGFEEAAQAVRDNPQLNRRVADLPDDAVGFLDAVRKYMNQQAQNTRGALAQNRNQTVSSGWEQDARTIRQAAINGSRDPATGVSPYEVALNVQAQVREQHLAPLLQGPLGRLAKRSQATRQAIEVLFPTNPLPNSANEVATAVGAVAARNPGAARQLVRAHIESVFNEATQNLVGGEAQRGGAKFAAVIAGNPQQRANLQAAMEALPNGADTWAGFNRYLEILEATGRRQGVGSLTAYNIQDLKDLGRGRLVTEGAKTVSSPTRVLSMLGDAWDRWQLGRNLNELAGIMTNPNSAGLLRQIAARPAGSREAAILAARLTMMAGLEVGRDKQRERNKPRDQK